MASNAENSGSGPKRVKRSPRKKVSTTEAAPVKDDIIIRSNDVPTSQSAALFQRGNVRHVDVTNFLRQLIMLLEAGTPLLRSLKTLTMRGERASTRALVSDIAEYVETGNPLWQAFDRHPRYFDTVFVNLIKASEASGTLVTVLRRLVDYREDRELLRKRVRSAMIYPVILILACFGVLLLLTNIVVPQFQEMFARSNLTIPPITQKFLSVSNFFQVWWWAPLAVIVALILVYRMWYIKNPVRRLNADRIKLHIPIVGPIIHKNAIVELTRTMSLLLRSGLSMMSTLDLTRNAIHNRAVAHSLQGVRDSVEVGGGLETPLREAVGIIPAVVTDMFVTGEESGAVDQVAEQIADVYEEEVKISVGGLGEALQPVFTLVVGMAVLLLFVALFLPLIGMLDSLGSAGV